MRPKVLVLTSHPIGVRTTGADSQLALALLRRIDDVEFRWFGDPIEGVHGRPVPLVSRSGMPGRVERVQATVLGAVLEHRVDLVHVVATMGSGYRLASRLRSALPRRARRPVIHTVPAIRSDEDLRGAQPIGRTVVLSSATERRLRVAGFDDVRLIPPGIDLERWPQSPPPRHATPSVLFAGHNDDGGGAEEAVAVAAEAARRGVSLRLRLAVRPRPGEHERRTAERLIQLARDGGLTDVDVLTTVRDMPALLRESAAIVLPARRLAGKADVPLVVLEALATGRPELAYDLVELRSVRDVITTRPVGDVQGLAAALTATLGDAGAPSGAAAGRRLVEERFSDAAMAAAYRELYGLTLDAGSA